MTPWVPFWFEGNRFFNWVHSPSDWAKVREAYFDWTVDELLDEAKHSSVDTRHIYGLRYEHTGETLREFFTRHNMPTEGAQNAG